MGRKNIDTSIYIDNAGRRCKIQPSFLNPGGFLWALEQNRRRNSIART